MSTRNRLKRLEKLAGAVDIDQQDEALRLLTAWYACKLERFETLRDDRYAPPTNEQRALAAKTPYERIQRAFRTCVPLRLHIDRLTRRAGTNGDDEAKSSTPEGV